MRNILSCLLFVVRAVHVGHRGVVKQDKDITLDVIHRLVEDLELEYIEADSDKEKVELADMTVFILAFFLGALKGEEVVNIVLGKTRGSFHWLLAM